MTIELPKILTFERKLEPSDALMYAGEWSDIHKEDGWEPVTISVRTGRGTKSHYLGDKHEEKADPNIFEGDSAFLPAGKDTLKVSFTLRVIGNLGKPFSCNSPNFERAIIEKITGFKGADGSGLNRLADRYAYNIANGRFLWRNRVCAEAIKICVSANCLESPLNIDAREFSLNAFNNKKGDGALEKLSNAIKNGLNGSDDHVLLKISAYVKLGEEQQVFPSQEMNMGNKKKTLFGLNKNQAAIHSVKIGNAIRTIDTWYGDKILVLTGKKKPKTEEVTITENDRIPIAIEPYGAVTHRGSVYRYAENNLYALLPKWVKGEINDKDQINYVVANLIRGGVFNNESDKKG